MSQTSLFGDHGIVRGAVLSPCALYRYSLTRVWCGAAPDARRVLYVCLNPSTADAEKDDPTLRRCMGFARREGGSSLELVNLFAFRATKPADMAKAPDPVGPEADAAITAAAARAAIIIAAWGASGPKGWEARAADVLRLLTRHGDVYCLGRTAAGAPRHPLYLPENAALEIFAPRVN